MHEIIVKSRVHITPHISQHKLIRLKHSFIKTRIFTRIVSKEFKEWINLQLEDEKFEENLLPSCCLGRMVKRN